MAASRGWRQGWYWIWWYPGSRRRSADYRYHPLIRPSRYIRHTLSLSLGCCVLTANIRNTHVRPHMACPRPRWLYTPASYLLTSRYGTCVISREERGRIRGNWRMRVLFFSVSYFPSPSVSVRLTVGRETRRDVTCSFTVWFFFCGALNHLLVRAGVYTQWAIGRPTIGDVSVCMSEGREGFRWLIEREPYKYPRECEGCASALDNDRDRPAMIGVANVYMLMIIQVHIKCLHDNF